MINIINNHVALISHTQHHPTHTPNTTQLTHPTHTPNSHTQLTHPTHTPNSHTQLTHPTHAPNSHTYLTHPTPPNSHTKPTHPTCTSHFFLSPSPGHSAIIQPLFSIKLDPETSLQVIFVLTVHDGSMGVLK